MTHLTRSGKVVIAGGNGFLGASMAQHLAEQGMSIVILSRRPTMKPGPWKHVAWDGRIVGDWASELNGATALINLAGRSVDCIKTPDHQDEILRSRVESTRVLGQALRTLNNPPPVWVQMSTSHIYGDPPTAVCVEESPSGYGLAPFVAEAWEKEFHSAVLPKQRPVIFRTSFVLGQNQGFGNGALAKLAFITKLGLGGKVGSGTQGMSWIHQTDFNRIFEQGIFDDSMNGVYITSAPTPVSQVEFMRELRRAMRVPIGLPAFEWMVRLGVPLILKSDPELALYGRYVIPQRLLQSGFEFRYPTLASALNELYQR
ncbi:MAG TPA: TIGR01777 family oxidoreductase [Planctomicrobium sp.]|nr:TIGR01777 family oxidoreductase [Planctomicrobium sp.]